MKSLIGIVSIIEKELKQLFRNKLLVALIVFDPIFIVLIVTRIYCFDLKNVNVALVDSDNSALSCMLAESVDCSDKLTLSGIYATYDEAYMRLENGDVDCIAVFPKGFEGSVLSGEAKKIQLSVKAVDITKGILGTKIVKSSFLSAISKYFKHQGIEVHPESDYISEANLFNPTMDYLLFMIPVALLAAGIFICSNVTVNSMTSEKASGVVELMNVCPQKPWVLILAKVISCYLIGLIVMGIVLLSSYIFFGLPQVQSMGLVFIFFSIYLLGLPAFAFFIGNITTNPTQAFFFIVATLTIASYMAGYVTPAESMDEWIQKLNIINPSYYLVVALRSIYLKGAELKDLLHPLAVMTIQCGVLWTLAICTFKKIQ